jgi:hypothetical protein
MVHDQTLVYLIGSIGNFIALVIPALFQLEPQFMGTQKPKSADVDLNALDDVIGGHLRLGIMVHLTDAGRSAWIDYLETMKTLLGSTGASTP